jgi:hypothetical protein
MTEGSGQGRMGVRNFGGQGCQMPVQPRIKYVSKKQVQFLLCTVKVI